MCARVFTIALVAVLSFGCATKRYGRMSPLTSKEAETLTCTRIEEEVLECEVFLADVYSTGVSGADIAAFLGDFGIGNSMERNAALKSGRVRLVALYELRETNCGLRFPTDWEDRIKADAEVMAKEKTAARKKRAQEYGNSRHRGDYIVTPDPNRK